MRRDVGPQLTPELAAKIKGFYTHTTLNYAQIAAKLGGLNQGRVSEVVRGRRYPHVQPAPLKELDLNE